MDVFIKEKEDCMEENNGQATSPKASLLEQVPGYGSVKEAAHSLGISERSVYGYLETKG